MATNSWEELQAKIIATGRWKTRAFEPGLLITRKQRLLTKFGVNLPAELDIQVHEDTATTTHLVLPATGKLDEDRPPVRCWGKAPG